MSETSRVFSETAYYHFCKLIPPSNLPQMVVSSLTSGGMPSGENLQLYFHEGLRRHNLYPHFQIMDFSISNGNLRCKFCLECSMVGAMTMLAYVNSVSPSCVYFITLHRLHQQTCAESEHNNQNQNQKFCQSGILSIC